MLRGAGLDPEHLELELTESMLMDEKLAARSLGALKAGGITLALDDFGTGYSSLSYLRKFAFDVLKIDRSFIQDIQVDAGDNLLVAAIIAMSHSMGIKTVAEGVETVEQLEFLRSLGCEEVQGYLLAKPMTAEDCGAWLQARSVVVAPAGIATAV